MIISVDTGKYATKAICKNNRIYFRSTAEELFIKDRGRIIEFAGKRYLVGEENYIKVDLDATKAKFLHKLCLYTAIAELIENTKESVDVVISCPMNLYIDQGYREEYRRYMLDETVEIKINDIPKKISIKNTMVLPEGVGIIFNNNLFTTEEVIGIIDIGGLNINGSIFTKAKPIKESIFTLNKGTSILLAELKNKLNGHFGKYEINTQEYQLINYLKNKKAIFYGLENRLNEEINIFIQEFLVDYVKNIIYEMKKYNWDTKGLKIIFTGGGSLLLKDTIKSVIPYASISNNCIWDNVEGNFKAAQMIWR